MTRTHREETENLKMKILEQEEKLQSMEQKMSLDIELLEAECHSLQEFRIKRDELMRKFEMQEQNFKEQEDRHKKNLYDYDRKMTLDKKNLRESVENKLLELSNEFTKKNELRVAASTQRLVRENISLNLELDRMMATVERLQAENDDVKKKQKEIAYDREIDKDQIKRLVKTATQQVKIIERLTLENERMRVMRMPQEMLKTGRTTFGELSECKRKLKILEGHVNMINFDNRKLKYESYVIHKENERIGGILRKVQLTIKSSIRGETVQDDPEFREYQRKNFPHELQNILEDLESRNSKSSEATLSSVSNMYTQNIHKTDWPTMSYDTIEEILERLPKAEPDKSIVDTPTVSSVSTQVEEESDTSVNCLIDVVSGSLKFPTESERSESDLEETEKEKPKFDIVKEEYSSVSSSDDQSRRSIKSIAHATLSDDDKPSSLISTVPEDGEDDDFVIQKFNESEEFEIIEKDEFGES